MNNTSTRTPLWRRWWMIGIYVVVACWILLAIIIAAAGSGPDRAAPSVDRPTPAYPEVGPNGVWAAYAEHEARANSLYKGKVFRVTFRVDEVEDDHVVHYVNNSRWNQAQFRMELDDLLALEVGNVVTANCRCNGLVLDSWLRFDCR